MDADTLLASLTQYRPKTISKQSNICDDCNAEMFLISDEYMCQFCGLIKCNELPSMIPSEASNNTLRISTGANKGKYYYVLGDYSKLQYKIVLDQLLSKYKENCQSNITLDVLISTATKYNNIQKYVLDEDNKKFVKRGNVKDEILAAILYHECNSKKISLKRSEIASFMKLSTLGFAKGDDILFNLKARGLFEIVHQTDNETIENFLNRYLANLQIDNEFYRDFVTDLVNESERIKMCMNSQLSSKIVGALWIIITKCKLPITSQKLEECADKIKKTTFIKFYKVVIENMDLFVHIFAKYNIPR